MDAVFGDTLTNLMLDATDDDPVAADGLQDYLSSFLIVHEQYRKQHGAGTLTESQEKAFAQQALWEVVSLFRAVLVLVKSTPFAFGATLPDVEFLEKVAKSSIPCARMIIRILAKKVVNGAVETEPWQTRIIH
jgi:hypothetical protein